jgi:ferredoxin
VDLDLCQGHGACVEEAPEVFALDEKESKVLVRDERPPEALRPKVKNAVRFCPTRALSLTDD